MIRTIIIDDEMHALNYLERLLKSYDQIDISGKYTDVTKVFDHIKSEKVHIIFLDIEMPKMNGIQAANKILEIDSDIQIVFVTAYNDYAVYAFEVEALDYVMKPIIKRRLDKTLERILKKYKEISDDKKIENRVTCFGNLEIKIGNEIIKWRTTKAKEFIAFLIHHRGKFVHKSKIIEMLWPDKDEKQATKLLHTSVYYARKALKEFEFDNLIIYTNKMYKLDLSTMVIDIDEFDNEIKSYDVVTNETVDKAKRILSLYKGGYYEENDYYWAVNEQARFRKIHMNLLMKVSDLYMSEGKYRDAIVYLKEILVKEPYIEEIHRKLLKGYIKIQDYINFKEHYKYISNDFKEELGLELSDVTKELYIQGIARLNE